MASISKETIRRLNQRLIPLFIAAYIINFLDRVNVGFAALQMNGALRITAEMYGFGAGIFFIGYVIFEVPSNLVLAKVGARYWLARIMVSWGVLAACMAFVGGTVSFLILRFLLGVAEAGFVPALLVYLAQWYPAEEGAGAVSKIWSAKAISIVIGAPLSGFLLSLDGLAGFAGWQLMFIVEGVPAVIFGVLLLCLVTDRPDQATWLRADQRAWLIETLANEKRDDERRQSSSRTIAAACGDARVWILGLQYACLGFGFFGVTLWLPQIVKQVSGLGNVATSLVTAVPFAFAVVAMILVGRHSDRTGERYWHITLCTVVAAISFAISGHIQQTVLSLAVFSIGAMGLWSVIGVFWQLPKMFLTGPAAAVGTAIINSCGSIGGFLGPFVMGWIRSRTVDFAYPMMAVAAALVVAAAISAAMRINQTPVASARASI